MNKKSLKSIFKFFQISKIGRIEFLNFHVLINHFWRLLNSRFFKYSRLKQIDQFNSNRIENMTRGDTTMLLPPQTCPISPQNYLDFTSKFNFHNNYLFFRSSTVSFWYEKVQHCSTTSEMEFHQSILEWKRPQSS